MWKEYHGGLKGNALSTYYILKINFKRCNPVTLNSTPEVNADSKITLSKYRGRPWYEVPIWERDTRDGFWAAMLADQALIFGIHIYFLVNMNTLYTVHCLETYSKNTYSIKIIVLFIAVYCTAAAITLLVQCNLQVIDYDSEEKSDYQVIRFRKG